MSRFSDPNAPHEQSQQQEGGVGQSVSQIGQKVKDVAQQQFENVRQTASEYYEQGREKAMEWERGIENYVREQPMKSICIAASVGLLLGILWRRW